MAVAAVVIVVANSTAAVVVVDGVVVTATGDISAWGSVVVPSSLTVTGLTFSLVLSLPIMTTPGGLTNSGNSMPTNSSVHVSGNMPITVVVSAKRNDINELVVLDIYTIWRRAG